MGFAAPSQTDVTGYSVSSSSEKVYYKNLANTGIGLKWSYTENNATKSVKVYRAVATFKSELLNDNSTAIANALKDGKLTVEDLISSKQTETSSEQKDAELTFTQLSSSAKDAYEDKTAMTGFDGEEKTGTVFWDDRAYVYALVGGSGGTVEVECAYVTLTWGATDWSTELDQEEINALIYKSQNSKGATSFKVAIPSGYTYLIVMNAKYDLAAQDKKAKELNYTVDDAKTALTDRYYKLDGESKKYLEFSTEATSDYKKIEAAGGLIPSDALDKVRGALGGIAGYNGSIILAQGEIKDLNTTSSSNKYASVLNGSWQLKYEENK